MPASGTFTRDRWALQAGVRTLGRILIPKLVLENRWSSSSSTGSESPRLLERAASEPPNKFKQRLNISSANPGGYSTIPENSTEAQLTANSDRLPRSSNHRPSGGQNPIKTSASAPSVPGYQEPSQPVAPPRRSPPRTIGVNASIENSLSNGVCVGWGC